MLFTIDQAKKYFQFNVNDIANFELALTNAIRPAQERFKKLLGIAEYTRAYNMPDSITADSIADDTIIYDYTNCEVKQGEMIVLDDLVFYVTDSDNTTLTINKAYTGSEVIFVIETLNTYRSIFAWLLLHEFATIAKELFMNIVLDNNQEFGEGNMTPNYKAIANYKQSLLNNVNTEFSLIKENIVGKKQLVRN